MNDLFRRDPPRMSDEEDRRTWERVRTAATRPGPWWAALWARPAVRFGLPALAVVLVAVVWVVVEQPASTHAPEPTVGLMTAPAPVARRELAAKPAPRELDALQKKFAEAPAPARPQALRDQGAAGKASAGAAGAAIDGKDKEEKAQAGAEVTALRAGVRSATAPAPAAPAPSAANELVPEDRPGMVARTTFGAMKQTTRGDSLAVDARGGRSDEMVYEYGSSTTLGQVGPLVTHRPLSFTAPLPVITSAGAPAPETARIELSATGVVSARIVARGGGTPEMSFGGGPPPRQTFARFEDAGPAEQILLVAYAADRMAGGAPPSLVQRLLVQAQRLEARDDEEQAAAKALLARLEKKNWGGAAWR